MESSSSNQHIQDDNQLENQPLEANKLNRNLDFNQIVNEPLIKYASTLKKNMKVKTLQDNPENEVQKVYLVLGPSGAGKSSFVQYLTNDSKAEIGHGENSHTKECRVFFQNEKKFIDSPGINDTQENKYKILLNIVIYLKENNFKLENLFIIYVSNKPIQQHLRLLQEFAYTYFLYDLFEEQITFQDVEKLVKEYFQSTSLLNWEETGFQFLQDSYAGKRLKIFEKKDIALNRIEYVQNLHIFVQTYYDKINKRKLKELNKYEIEFLREQIWSNIREMHDQMHGYKEYISDQVNHLFCKIEKIISIYKELYVLQKRDQIQYVLLIGASQVGKSSLIEQLKRISGLRGSGDQSKTSFCQTYLVEHEKVKYFFIDTPGFDGTEKNQDSLHNLKIVADFLRRNKISEFKVLYMRNADLEKRNGMPQILNYLSVFIQQMFDQDCSLIDSNYLRELIRVKTNQSQIDSQLTSHQLIKKQILTIERVDGERNNLGKVYINIFKDKSVEFQTDFFDNGHFFKVDENDDQIQQKTLFMGINDIDTVSIEIKIQMQMEAVRNCLIINNEQDYMSAYKEVYKQYQQQNKIQDEITKQQSYQNDIMDNLKKQKIEILKEQNRKMFIVIGDFHNTPQMKDYIQKEFHQQKENNNQQNHQIEINNIIQNNIQKHFLKLEFTPLLFEANQNPNNIFLSRKQLYYWQLVHQLKPFLKENEQINQEKLEKLSIIKILQELTTCYYLQSKELEQKCTQNPEKVFTQVKFLISTINTALGTGAQIFRYATYFRKVSEATVQAQQVAKGVKFAATWVNCLTSALNLGIDLYQYSKGLICLRQMTLNTAFNIGTIALSVISANVSGYGLLAGGPIGFLGLLGFAVSAVSFVSSQTYDETLGIVLKSIIDDQRPNQNLLYFQKSQFLNEQNIKNYSQQKETYNMFRQLEKENFKLEDQNKFLLKLFNNCEPLKLQDEISQYLVKNIISNLFQFNINKQKYQNNKEYLRGIEKQIEHNQQIINTFYCNFNYQDEKLLQTINSNQEQLKITFDKIQEVLEDDENQNICLNQDQTLKNIEDYQESLNQFIKHIKQTNYTYKEYVNFGNGLLRKCDRFPITFNGYCNLVHEKSKYIFKQDTISEISKNNNCFEVKPQYEFKNRFFQISNDELTTYLNLITSSEIFTSNRYLLKLYGQKDPNFSCMKDTEILDCKVEYSIDLYEVANQSKSFEQFIEKVKNETKQEFRIDNDKYLRLRGFFKSIDQLKEFFM